MGRDPAHHRAGPSDTQPLPHVGVAATIEPVPPAPRRHHDDVITVANHSGAEGSATARSDTAKPGEGRESGA